MSRVFLCLMMVIFSTVGAASQDLWRQPYTFEHLSQEQGLSYNTVTSFTQDKQGFLWIGTFNGLNRYDGAQFKTYLKINSGDTLSKAIPREIGLVYADSRRNVWVVSFGNIDNIVVCFNPQTEDAVRFSLPMQNIKRAGVNSIKESADGTLWMTTLYGLLYADNRKKEFLSYTNNDGKPFLNIPLGGIVETSAQSEKGLQSQEKRLWIRKHGGLIECDIAKQTIAHYNFTDSLADTKFFYGSLVQDSSGYLWCANVAGLYCFDPRTKSAVLHIPREKIASASLVKSELENDFMTRSMLCTPDGSLWCASNSGIVVVRYQDSPQNYSLELLQNDEANPNSLSGNTVRTLFADRTGVVWAGGEPFGINKFTPYRQKFLLFRHLPFNPNSLSNNYVRGMCLTRSNFLWVGTQFGGISGYDPQKRLWRRFNKAAGTKPTERKEINETWAIFEDRFGTVWAGTRGNGLLRYDEVSGEFVQSHLVSENALIQIIQEDRAGNLLLGTRGNTAFVGVFVIPPDRNKKNITFIPTKRAQGRTVLSGDVLAIHEDHLGKLWIGGTDEIMCLNIATKEIEDKTSKFLQDVQAVPSDIGGLVVSITEDKDRTLWFSSKGLGIVRYDRRKDRFIAMTEQQGLPNNSVYAVLEDAAGNFWISSDAGITRWNRAENTFRTFTTADGLQGREYNRLSYGKGTDGMMFFGGINGFNAFHPDRLLFNPTPPPVVLTSVKIFAMAKAPGNVITTSAEGRPTLELRYDQNFVTFQFAAMDFHVPENNQYAYTLEGLDNEWIYAGTRHEAVYTGLDPGEYTLRVRAANNDGVWNNAGLTLHVVVLPPWWKTWWFRAMLVFAGVGAIGLIIQIYRRRIQRLQEHRQELLLHIAERERAEAELQSSEEKFRVLFETSPLGMVLWSIDGHILQANQAFANLLGYQLSDKFPTNFWQILGGETGTNPTVTTPIRYALEQRGAFGPVEHTLFLSNGKKSFVVLYGIAVLHRTPEQAAKQNGDGVLMRIWTVMEDVTERKQALDAMLRYQLNPHFMFNVLHSVNALMGENQDNARDMIVQFSSLLRHTLVASNKQTAPLSDEIEAVRHYLAIEKLRFEEDLEVSIAIQPDTLALGVPVFLIQPLVENAIKYGMQTTDGTLFITITGGIENGELVLEVTNTGAWVEALPKPQSPFPPTTASINAGISATDLVKQRSTGIGLENLRNRLAQLYAAGHTFGIQQEGGTVKVRITIALQELFGSNWI